MKDYNNIRIIFTGGGTLGSVTPLLAVREFLQNTSNTKHSTAQCLWIGTHHGIEQKFLQNHSIPFIGIFSGKLRRYISWRNLFDPLFLVLGFLQSLWIIARYRPHCIIHAGGFVGVPVVWAAWLLGRKSIVLQLDIRPSFANILASPFAYRIGVACDEEVRFFPSSKTEIVGIPVRKEIFEWQKLRLQKKNRQIMFEPLGINDNEKTLFVVGGGTGAQFLNTTLWKLIPFLIRHCHIIHCVGKGKMDGLPPPQQRYHPFEFLEKELVPYLALSDIVVTRAGMGMLSECAALAKSVILIPIPNSHQEENANFFKKKGAALVFSQQYSSLEDIRDGIITLFDNQEKRRELSENIRNIFPLNAHARVIRLIEQTFPV